MVAQGNTSAVPVALKPGVISSYGNGWKQLWKHFLELFLIFIIYIIIGGVGGFICNLLFFLQPFFTVLVNFPLSYGVSYAYLRAARGDEVEIHDMFAAFQNYWNAVFSFLLVGVIVFIGFILLIVPGIIFACKLAFTPYLVVDKKMGGIEAIKESWRMTGGHAGEVFLIGLLGIPIFIAGLICLGVGAIISVMWISMALSSLYYAVSTAGSVTGQITQPIPPRPTT
jgi:uncharacterized membrane protein